MTQLTLSLIGGLCNAPLWFALPSKRRSTRAKITFSPWSQLTLKLPIRKLIRSGNHFVWTRSDGKQFVCRTIRQLVARIMDWDGKLLQGLLKSATSQANASRRHHR